jgi:hypothetical protein
MDTLEEITKTENTTFEEKYKRIQASMSKANKKYRESHKDVVNKIARDFYNRHKDDEEWKAKQREKSKKSYYKKKERLHSELTLISI